MKKRIGRKLTALVMAGVLMFALGSCGQQGGGEKEVGGSQGEQTQGEQTQEEQTQEEQTQGEQTQDGQQASGEVEDTLQEGAQDDVDGELVFDHEEELLYAKRFTMTRYQGGYTMFAMPDFFPDRQYLLVPEGKSVPEELPEGTVVLQLPLTSFRFASTSMVSLVDAIGGLDKISSVSTDVGGWYLDNVIDRMKAGTIKFSGKYSEPDYEMLMSDGVQVNVDTTMLAYRPEVMEKYDELGIVYVVECSSREEHPLGRVEWVKLWGAMMGMEEEAQEFFDAQVAEFERITSLDKLNLTALSFGVAEDNVEVHYDNSFYGSTVKSAGCNYPFLDEDAEDTTSYAKMGIEDFYELAGDTDYLFSLAYASLHTMQDLIDSNEVFEDFKAVKDGNVYVFKASFVQSAADIATAVSDIRAVLEDPSIEETKTLYKLK